MAESDGRREGVRSPLGFVQLERRTLESSRIIRHNLNTVFEELRPLVQSRSDYPNSPHIALSNWLNTRSGHSSTINSSSMQAYDNHNIVIIFFCFLQNIHMQVCINLLLIYDIPVARFKKFQVITMHNYIQAIYRLLIFLLCYNAITFLCRQCFKQGHSSKYSLQSVNCQYVQVFTISFFTESFLFKLHIRLYVFLSFVNSILYLLASTHEGLFHSPTE